jgi:ERCC4-related helicase
LIGTVLRGRARRLPANSSMPDPHHLLSAPLAPHRHLLITPSPPLHQNTTTTQSQTARKIHVAKFRAKRVSVLITTDVAARGIDIPLIDNVVNYDFPPKPELFVHRCALTGV